MSFKYSSFQKPCFKTHFHLGFLYQIKKSFTQFYHKKTGIKVSFDQGCSNWGEEVGWRSIRGDVP